MLFPYYIKKELFSNCYIPKTKTHNNKTKCMLKLKIGSFAWN